MPYPLPLTRTEAYLAYKAGVIQQSDLKPSLAVPRNGIDAWLAYWTGLTNNYPVKNVGKNLFDKDKALYNYFYTSTGSKSTYSKPQFYNNKFSPKSNKITMSFSAAHDRQNGSNIEANVRIVQYDANGNFISRFMSRVNGHTFTLDNNTESFILSVDNGPDAWFDDLQVEYGSTPTAYEPYTGEPLILQEEEAYIAYLCGVINEYPEKCLRRVGAYLRYIISARWGRPDHPLNREELYLSLIKTQFIPSGDPSSDIVIDGTAKAPFVDVKMYGDTYQQTYTGKNLYNKANYLDGIYINASTGAIGSSSGFVTIYAQISPSTQYTVSKLSTSRFIIAESSSIPAVGDTLNVLSAIAQTSEVKTITTGANASYLVIMVKSSSDTLTTGQILDSIQIEAGSTATSYEPYVGGQPSPSPDYPQPIQTVTGRQVVKVEGKNKYPFNDTAWSSTSTRTTWFFQDGATNAYGADVTDKTNYKITLPAGIYTMTAFDLSSNIINIQACANGESSEIIVTSPSNINSGNLSSTITLTETTTLCVRYLVTTPSLGIGNTKIQIEKGTATAYEPYSSNDYEINLGKNLFDVTATPWYSGRAYDGNGELTYWTGYMAIVAYQPVEPNSTYTFSNSTGKAIYFGLVFYDVNKNKISNVYSATRTFTTPANCHYVRFAIQNNSAPTWTQLELGSTATTYAPYFEPIELCKLGDYQDYIWKDGDDWKVHKAIKKSVFDQNSGWTKNQYGTNAYNIKTEDIFTAVAEIGVISPQFTAKSYNGRTDAVNNIIFADSNAGMTMAQRGITVRNTAWSDLTSFTTWVTSNPVTAYYVLATPTDTTITDQTLIDQLEALVAGGAENGTTYIKVNATDPNLPGLLYVEAPKYE